MASLTDIGVVQLDEDVENGYEDVDPNDHQHQPADVIRLLFSIEVPRPFFDFYCMLRVVESASDMDGDEGEDFEGENFACCVVGGVPAVGGLVEEAVVDPFCGCAVPDYGGADV